MHVVVGLPRLSRRVTTTPSQGCDFQMNNTFLRALLYRSGATLGIKWLEPLALALECQVARARHLPSILD